MLLIIQILFTLYSISIAGAINRQNVVRKYNPVRKNLSTTTPMQVGNGNFAFGADITGLQTILPFNILSSWCWCEDPLPTIPGQTEPSDFTGLDWWTHGRLVNYDQPNPAEAAISKWLIANPHRVNLGRIGFLHGGGNISVNDLADMEQTLDLYSGIMASEFTLQGHKVSVKTVNSPYSDSIAVDARSKLFEDGSLSVFFDYPLTTGLHKFEAPFVGNWTAVNKHSTVLHHGGYKYAAINHTLGGTTYFTSIGWEQTANISGPINETHRYVLQPTGTDRFTFTVEFSPIKSTATKKFAIIKNFSSNWWCRFWESGSFVDLTATDNEDAEELQRRIILSQYLLAVNSAGKDPPQESGLQNNGWYGKFHLEMVFWHLGNWARWEKWGLLNRSLGVYDRFLPSSIKRAQKQGYTGARLGKMSDPSGRSAPGEINSLLIWQQPHPMYFAELEYRSSPNRAATLRKWDYLLDQLATWMVSYSWWNVSTQAYDLGPPMYPSSENTNPNATYNPTFELAYWRFGLKIASDWKARQAIPVPQEWTNVLNNLAPLPIIDGAYSICADLLNMWNDGSYTSNHPSQIAVYGLLPATPGVDIFVVSATMERIAQTWNFTKSYGWDFPMLAMTSLRLGNADLAVSYLLNENFNFDDVGNPIGGTAVPTPYFPSSSSLLIAIAMMAGGWDGEEGGHFPEGWAARVEGFVPGI